MQKETIKTPPHLENIASFRDNQVGIYSVAGLHADNSKGVTIYFGRNDR